jgi:SAM-dependent methyltransferase
MKQWYETLFENYGKKYDQEPFTQGTMGECDFIENEIGRNRDLRILDIGCGTGRHAIELTRRGYSVTGVDLSEDQLQRARKKAAAAGLDITFIRQDARSLPFRQEFDVAVMLCEGGFPLMETDEMNYQILKSAAAALSPGGRLIFTTLNGLFPLFHSVKDFLNSNQETGKEAGKETGKEAGKETGKEFAEGSDPDIEEGKSESKNIASYSDFSFDLMTFRETSTIEIEDDSGNINRMVTSERYYVPSEITWLLKSLGFTEITIFGARLGEFSREHTLTTEDYEMLVTAVKPS